MIATTNALVQLARNGFAAFHTARRQQLHCLEGQLWVTQDGVARDFILSAGDTLEIDCDAQIAVSALRASRYHLAQTDALPCRRASAPRLVAQSLGLAGAAA